MTDHMPLDIPTPTPPGGLPVQLIRPFGLVLRRPHSAHPVIKLLGVLRARGALLAPTGEIPVDYEIDAFSAGSVRTATGGLTGAFDTWPDLAGVTETTGLAAQLRLAGGGHRRRRLRSAGDRPALQRAADEADGPPSGGLSRR